MKISSCFLLPAPAAFSLDSCIAGSQDELLLLSPTTAVLLAPKTKTAYKTAMRLLDDASAAGENLSRDVSCCIDQMCHCFSVVEIGYEEIRLRFGKKKVRVFFITQTGTAEDFAKVKMGYLGEFEYVDGHISGKIAVELIARLNKCGVISPRFDVGVKETEQMNEQERNHPNNLDDNDSVNTNTKTPRSGFQNNSKTKSEKKEMKWEIEEVTISSLLKRDNSLRNKMRTEKFLDHDQMPSKRFSKDVVHKYLNLMKPYCWNW
ncbi:hypothetical protein L6452_15683 [Arctium lappa]|uniref:Uncharacterized protein n=1 Tax=Arctium lappa TaxID=4217 RepID=A0ACB9CPC9_ARCLA|nr:hypothetical protein L6452_15683 [Arctium lappa]